MKKIWLAILALNTIGNSFGQVRLGLKAGVNHANIKINASVDQKALLGFHAGGMIQARLSEKFLFQPEVLYSGKGFQAPSIQFEDGQRVILNYLTVPLLLGYQPDKRITLLFGPELGLLTSAKEKYESAEFERTGMYNKLDVGVDFSVAVTPMKNLGLDLRYNYGVKSLGDVRVRDRSNNTTDEAKTAHRVLQLSVFYLFVH